MCLSRLFVCHSLLPHFSVSFFTSLINIYLFLSLNLLMIYPLRELSIFLSHLSPSILYILHCYNTMSLPLRNSQLHRTQCCPFLLPLHLIPISCYRCLFIARCIYFYLSHKTVSATIFISLASSKKLYPR